MSWAAPVSRVVTLQLCCPDEGVVLSWGFDDDGRLGHGSPGHHFTPKVIDALVGKHVVDISCGCWHSAVRCSDGEHDVFGPVTVFLAVHVSGCVPQAACTAGAVARAASLGTATK
jgi:hypothetical protein